MFNKLRVQGRFVVEVANVERGQSGVSVVQRIDFDGHDAVLRSGGGQTVTVPWKAGRGRIHGLLAAAGQSLDSAVPDPLTYPGEDLSVHQQWCELLYDAGSGAETLEHMVPGLHFVSIERRGTEAEIVLTDGPRRQMMDPGAALGFRNLTNYIARCLLETGGFTPQLHPRS